MSEDSQDLDEIVPLTDQELRLTCLYRATGGMGDGNVTNSEAADAVLRIAEKYYNWVKGNGNGNVRNIQGSNLRPVS